MPPSNIQISTSSLSRLLNEEASYHKEMETQQKRIDKLEKDEKDGKPEGEGEEGNREYAIRQEKKALEETKAVLPTIRERITSAREKLESILDTATNEQETEKAVAVLQQAKEIQKKDPDTVTVAAANGLGAV